MIFNKCFDVLTGAGSSQNGIEYISNLLLRDIAKTIEANKSEDTQDKSVKNPGGTSLSNASDDNLLTPSKSISIPDAVTLKDAVQLLGVYSAKCFSSTMNFLL